MQEKYTLDVCLSPGLISNYNLNDTVVVVVDIVRAGSSICTALSYGLEHIVALDDIETTKKLKDDGYIIAGERNGDQLEGFDYGNSPINLMDRKLEGKKLAMTTTNGTQLIKMATHAASSYSNVDILIGAFVNYSKVLNYLNRCNKNVLLVCAGWQNNPSTEDTIFSGKLARDLEYTSRYRYYSDSVIHSLLIYESAGKNLFDFIMDNSVRFSQNIGQLVTDIRYCLKEDVAKVLPFYKDGKFIKMEE